MKHNRLGKGANTDRRISMMRRAASAATERYSTGSRPKKYGPRPITLPKLKCLEQPLDNDDEPKGSTRT